MDQHRYLTTAQAAELLGIHRTTVLRLCEEGIIEARRYSYGSRATIRIPEHAVDAFLARFGDPDAEPEDDPAGQARRPTR